MPYIKQDRRPEVLNGLIQPFAWTVGDLNFLITVAVNAYVEGHGLSYATINDVCGVLSCARDEFYRRVAAPYENMKIDQNGDVYGFVEKPKIEIARVVLK